MAILLAAADASAERLPLRSFTSADGLAHNTVNRIVRDSRGFLWFCTADGLSRFDGYTFTNYTDDDGLPHRAVNDLIETRDHQYDVATNGGVVRLAGSASPIFEAVAVDDPDPLSRLTTTLYESRDGTIWAGTEKGLYRIAASTGLRALPVDIGIPHDYAEQSIVWDITETRDGALWIATPGGLYRRAGDGRVTRFTRRDGLPDDYLHDLLVDHDGRLWAGTRGGGFFRISTESPDGPIGIAERYSVRDGLPSPWVFQMFESSDGGLWIGTASGLAEVVRHEGAPPTFRNYNARYGLTYHDVTALNEDASGNLWMGTNTAGALKLARGGFVTFTASDGVGEINAIFEDASGALCFRGSVPAGPDDASVAPVRYGRFDGRHVEWFTPASIRNLGWVMERVTLRARDGEWWLGTGEGLFRFAPDSDFAHLRRALPIAHYSTGDGLASREAFRLFEDSRGHIWAVTVSSMTNGLARWDRAANAWTDFSGTPELPLKKEPARALEEDAYGDVWIGFGRGLARYRNGRFVFFGVNEGVPPGAVLDIHRDQSGQLWLASSRSGLVRVDQPDGDRPAFTVYTTAKGLSSNRAEVIVDDASGRIYVATGRALDRLDPATGRIKHFTTADGLAPGIVRAAFRDRNGALWFGTTGGLSRLMPTDDSRAVAPPVFVTGLAVGGASRAVSPLGERDLTLPDLNPSDNQFRIEFVGLGFAPGEALRYAVQAGGGRRRLAAHRRAHRQLRETVARPLPVPGSRGERRRSVQPGAGGGDLHDSASRLAPLVVRPAGGRGGWWNDRAGVSLSHGAGARSGGCAGAHRAGSS